MDFFVSIFCVFFVSIDCFELDFDEMDLSVYLLDLRAQMLLFFLLAF